MTDPTADAAKLLPHKTVPVPVTVDVDEGIAETVKYLQTIPGVRTHTSCAGGKTYAPYVMATYTEEARQYLFQRGFTFSDEGKEWGYIHPPSLVKPDEPENTRPQPAPLAGEPDFGALWVNSPGDSRPGELTTVRRAVDFGERMYRLGLAARHKVEDAEVAEFVSMLSRLDGWGHCTTEVELCEQCHFVVEQAEAAAVSAREELARAHAALRDVIRIADERQDHANATQGGLEGSNQFEAYGAESAATSAREYFEKYHEPPVSRPPAPVTPSASAEVDGKDYRVIAKIEQFSSTPTAREDNDTPKAGETR